LASSTCHACLKAAARGLASYKGGRQHHSPAPPAQVPQLERGIHAARQQRVAVLGEGQAGGLLPGLVRPTRQLVGAGHVRPILRAGVVCAGVVGVGVSRAHRVLCWWAVGSMAGAGHVRPVLRPGVVCAGMLVGVRHTECFVGWAADSMVGTNAFSQPCIRARELAPATSSRGTAA